MKFYGQTSQNKYYAQRIYAIIIIIIFSSVFISCKKYEDGPLLSLRSAKNRLTGSWVSKEIYVNNLYAELDFNLYSLEINKNNSLILSSSYSKLKGTWELVKNKEMINIVVTEVESSTGFTKSDFWEIFRLTNDDLWVKFIYFGGLTEIRFKKV